MPGSAPPSGMLERKGRQQTGQLEIPMESTLRPRDIQTRIRAGETPEAVAHAAGTSVEKIMAVRRRRSWPSAPTWRSVPSSSSVRRRASESGARTLGEAVAAHLRATTSTRAASSGTRGGARTAAGR